MKISVKKLHNDAPLPTFGSPLAAGADLYAFIPEGQVTIPPHETAMIGTGLAMAIPVGYWGGIYARSGIALRRGLRPANVPGVIDADYRGEIKIALHNDTNDPQTVKHGDRIAQLLITSVPEITYEEVVELDDTERGNGGFGHTGI